MTDNHGRGDSVLGLLPLAQGGRRRDLFVPLTGQGRHNCSQIARPNGSCTSLCKLIRWTLCSSDRVDGCCCHWGFLQRMPCAILAGTMAICRPDRSLESTKASGQPAPAQVDWEQIALGFELDAKIDLDKQMARDSKTELKSKIKLHSQLL